MFSCTNAMFAIFMKMKDVNSHVYINEKIKTKKPKETNQKTNQKTQQILQSYI